MSDGYRDPGADPADEWSRKPTTTADVSPMQRAVALLAEHEFDPISRLWDCKCTWEFGDDGHRTHAAHVAGVLAHAGLIPATQEWAVRYTNHIGRQILYTGYRNDESGNQKFAEFLRDEEDTPDAQVVTRWVGESEWMPRTPVNKTG